MCAVLQRQNRFAASLLGRLSDAGAPGRGEQVASPLRRPEGMLSPACWVCAVWQHFFPHPYPARGFARAKQESGSAVGLGVGCRSARPGGANPFPPAPTGRDAFPGHAEHNIKQSPLCWAALGQNPEQTACPPPPIQVRRDIFPGRRILPPSCRRGGVKSFPSAQKRRSTAPRGGHFQTHICAIHKGQAATGRLALVFATPAGLQ